jgi:hypothetical protein
MKKLRYEVPPFRMKRSWMEERTTQRVWERERTALATWSLVAWGGTRRRVSWA